MPDFQTWLKLVKLFLLIASSRWWRRWWWRRVLVVSFGSDHVVFALNLSRIGSGT